MLAILLHGTASANVDNFLQLFLLTFFYSFLFFSLFFFLFSFSPSTSESFEALARQQLPSPSLIRLLLQAPREGCPWLGKHGLPLPAPSKGTLAQGRALSIPCPRLAMVSRGKREKRKKEKEKCTSIF